MSAPPTKKNTFLQISNKIKIDSVSKNFILLEMICGLFRLPVLGVTKKYFIFTTFGLTALCNILVTYFVYPLSIFQLSQIFNLIQFLSCTLLGNALHGRVLHFYTEINKIDSDLSFKVSSHVIWKYVFYIFQFFFMGISFGVLFYFLPEVKFNIIYFYPMKLLHYLELNYYGHLFSLIIPRLKLLKDIINVCYNPEKPNTDPYTDADFGILKKTQKKCNDYDVVLLINSYNNFIKAYDYLNSAIKWQMVITLITIFIVGLQSMYHFAKQFLYGDESAKSSLVLHIFFLILEFIPLTVPCLYANEVCNETDQLNEILTCRLYENRLGKKSRRAARALLDLLKTRPLYFSLLHMFYVDIALPLKILGLILTYLIILLQFDKIINPDQVRGPIG